MIDDQFDERGDNTIDEGEGDSECDDNNAYTSVL